MTRVSLAEPQKLHYIFACDKRISFRNIDAQRRLVRRIVIIHVERYRYRYSADGIHDIFYSIVIYNNVVMDGHALKNRTDCFRGAHGAPAL